MTVISGDRILVRAVGTSQGTMVIRPWESQASWYDAGQHSARFFILSELSSACPPAARHQWLVSLTATFGPPAATRQFPGFRVLIWHHNLLGNLTAVAHGRPQGC
jgi:hypothetical protein